MDRDRSVRTYRLFAVAFYVAGIAICVLGAMRFQSNLEDVFQWLPDNSPERDVYDDFVNEFGVDDFLVVTWAGLTIDDENADQFAETLTDTDERGLIHEAMSGRGLLRQLIKQRRRSVDSMVSPLKGFYFGPDGRTTCIVVMLTERGMNDRGTAVRHVKQTAEELLGITGDDLILAGYPQVGAYGDWLVRNSIVDFVGPACLIATLVAWICLRSIKMIVMVLAISGIAAGMSVAVVTLSGAKWGALSSVIPTLAYILTVSGSLHLISYSRSRGDERLFTHVLRIGWKPCLFSCLTTAVGMLSLCRSEFPAIREFGVYCAGGVVASLACQLLLVPCALDWLNPDNIARDPAQPSRFLQRILPWSDWIVIVFVAVTAFAAVGLQHLRSDLEVERNFTPDTPVMKNIGWLEENIGPVEQTELLIDFRSVDPGEFSKRLRAVRKVKQELVSSPSVAAALSIGAFLPEEPSGRSIRDTAARSGYRQRVNESREELTRSGYLRIKGDSELWRISLRFAFLEPANFKELKDTLPQVAHDTIQALLPHQEFSVCHTGVSLLYNVAQEELVADLYRNFAFAFLMIFPLMILVLRSFRRGVLAMIPNLFPAVLAYGMLGWLDYPLDVGMSIVACVALGIAVDDTTHFMLRFQDLKAEPGIDARIALNMAFRQCSRAMLQTSLITGFGLIPFLFSQLATMTRFASLLMVLVSLALLCDLVLLPSLLKPKDRRSGAEES